MNLKLVVRKTSLTKYLSVGDYVHRSEYTHMKHRLNLKGQEILPPAALPRRILEHSTQKTLAICVSMENANLPKGKVALWFPEAGEG